MHLGDAEQVLLVELAVVAVERGRVRVGPRGARTATSARGRRRARRPRRRSRMRRAAAGGSSWRRSTRRAGPRGRSPWRGPSSRRLVRIRTRIGCASPRRVRGSSTTSFAGSNPGRSSTTVQRYRCKHTFAKVRQEGDAVQEPADGGDTAVGVDGHDVGAGDRGVDAVGAELPREAHLVVVPVRGADRPERPAGELRVRRRDGRGDRLVTGHVDERVDVPGLLGEHRADRGRAGRQSSRRRGSGRRAGWRRSWGPPRSISVRRGSPGQVAVSITPQVSEPPRGGR